MKGAPPRYPTKAPHRQGRVGFYGCTADRGKVIRCGFAGEGDPPASAMVSCPACGAEHRAAPMWRPPTAADNGREADVLIEGRETA
jgi:hypothetical protein